MNSVKVIILEVLKEWNVYPDMGHCQYRRPYKILLQESRENLYTHRMALCLASQCHHSLIDLIDKSQQSLELSHDTIGDIMWHLSYSGDLIRLIWLLNNYHPKELDAAFDGASKANNQKILDFLKKKIESQKSSVKERYQNIALQGAIQEGHLYLVQDLLGEYKNLDIKKAIIDASRIGHYVIVKELISQYQHKLTEDDIIDVLSNAVRNNRAKVVSQIISSSQMNYLSVRLSSLLIEASQCNSFDVIRELVDFGLYDQETISIARKRTTNLEISLYLRSVDVV